MATYKKTEGNLRVTVKDNEDGRTCTVRRHNPNPLTWRPKMSARAWVSLQKRPSLYELQDEA